MAKSKRKTKNRQVNFQCPAKLFHAFARKVGEGNVSRSIRDFIGSVVSDDAQNLSKQSA